MYEIVILVLIFTHFQGLGQTLDSGLTFKTNIDYNNKKANKAISILYCILKKYSPVKKKLKILTYKSYIRPILTYACPTFAHYAKSHMKKLQIIQNKALRMALSALYSTRIAELHHEAKIPTIEVFIDKLTKKFYESCDDSSNKLIKRLGKIQCASKKHRTPKSHLV